MRPERRRCLRFVHTSPLRKLVAEPQRLAEVLAKQVYVALDREARRVVPEPPLHLDGVVAALEEHRRAGVAEGVEARPRGVDLLGHRAQNPPEDILRLERRAAERRE